MGWGQDEGYDFYEEPMNLEEGREETRQHKIKIHA